MRLSRTLAFPAMLGLLLVIGAAPARGADQVDNPQYQAWSKFAVGSSQTLAGEMGGNDANTPKMTMESTRKLVEKTDDHVVLEVTATVSIMGQQHTAPARKVTVPAKAEQQDLKSIGSEDVQAAGKTFSCKVFEMSLKDVAAQRPGGGPRGGGAATAPQGKAKVWISDDVPGGLVKIQVDTPQGTMTQTLKSYEAK
jgi:hypothetical protein